MILDRIKDNLVKVENLDIPNYIFSFLERYDKFNSFSDFHKSLMDYLGDIPKKPTLNQSMLYYDLAKLQHYVDKKLAIVEKYSEQLKRLEDDPESSREEKFRCEKVIERNERDFQMAIKDLLKYTNDGVNRETPKKIENTVTVVKPSDIAKMMKQSERVIDAEYTKE